MAAAVAVPPLITTAGHTCIRAPSQRTILHGV